MIRIFAAFTLLALAGCIQSPVPLESGGAKVSDPELIGLWKFNIGGDPAVATIRQDANGDFLADVVAYWEPGPKIATRHFQLILARLGENRYMSIRDTELSPKYFLVRYQIDSKDRFRMYGAYSEELIAALEQKRLPGQLEPDRHMSTVELTASSGQLLAYFREHGASAFHQEGQLAFVRTSSTQLPPHPQAGKGPKPAPE
jgi:hypothetical protein